MYVPSSCRSVTVVGVVSGLLAVRESFLTLSPLWSYTYTGSGGAGERGIGRCHTHTLGLGGLGREG